MLVISEYLRYFIPPRTLISPEDEIDSMLTSRSSGEHEAARRLKTEFLVQLDGAGTSREHEDFAPGRDQQAMGRDGFRRFLDPLRLLAC